MRELLTLELQMEKVSQKTPSTESQRIALDISTVLFELELTFLYQGRSIGSDLANQPPSHSLPSLELTHSIGILCNPSSSSVAIVSAASFI